MSAKAIRELLTAGARYDVTNHYITREDHPCYGTHRRTVERVSTGGITFDIGGRTGWPKAADIRLADDGAITFHGYPHDGDLFLTLKPVTS